MMRNLTPRSVAALAVVAVSFFLMVCIAQFGAAEFSAVQHATKPGLGASLSGWLVQTIGAGVWALVLLPLVWGVVCYFQEKTPDLILRLAGTVVLAVAISTIAGLCKSGLWAGHLGIAVAGALGGLSSSLGGFGTALAWLVALALLATSLLFATDWGFHELRRAGRTSNEPAPAIAVEPASAELLLDPAEAEPRAFVHETPRAAVAAAEMAETVRSTPDAAEAPAGWSASEEQDGRTVIAAPTGYRGVEFLPTSDELAIPDDHPRPRAVFAATEETESVEVDLHPAAAAAPEPWFEDDQFHDDQLVTTSDAAFFLEEASDDTAEWETQDIGDVTRADAEAPVVEAPVVEEEVEEAVQVLFEAVTAAPVAEPADAAPASGIGLPADSPFFDEVFAVDAGWPYAGDGATTSEGGTDGGSAAADMASVLAAAPAEPAAPAVAVPEEPRVEEPAEAFVAFDDDVVVSRLPAEAFDDLLAPSVEASEEPSEEPVSEPVAEQPASGIAIAPEVAAELPPAAEPAPVSEPVVVAPPVYQPVFVAPPLSMEPAPQLPLFAEASSASADQESSAAAVATLPELDLARLHTMELDPLFHDAVNAILERGRASAVVLQRQLGIGYARGIRILDQMTTAGLVGPDTPTGSREIRVTRDAWREHAGS